MNKKIWKLLKKKSEKERERDKLMLNLIGYSSSCGFMAVGFIGGLILGISEKAEGTELKIDWKKFKEFFVPLGWCSIALLVIFGIFYTYYYYKSKEITTELARIQERLEDALWWFRVRFFLIF